MKHPIVVQSFIEAKAAFQNAEESGEPLLLVSVSEAAASLGAKGFLELISAAAEGFPNVDYTAILDCGDQAGLAMNALRLGAKDISVDLPLEVRVKIEDMAAKMNARVHIRPDD